MESEIKYTQCSASKLLALLPSSGCQNAPWARGGRRWRDSSVSPECRRWASRRSRWQMHAVPPSPPPPRRSSAGVPGAGPPPAEEGWRGWGRTGRGPAARGLRCGQFTSPRAPHGGARGTTQGPGGRDRAAGAGRGGKIDSPGCGLELRAHAEPLPPRRNHGAPASPAVTGSGVSETKRLARVTQDPRRSPSGSRGVAPPGVGILGAGVQLRRASRRLTCPLCPASQVRDPCASVRDDALRVSSALVTPHRSLPPRTAGIAKPLPPGPCAPRAGSPGPGLQGRAPRGRPELPPPASRAPGRSGGRVRSLARGPPARLREGGAGGAAPSPLARRRPLSASAGRPDPVGSPRARPTARGHPRPPAGGGDSAPH